MNKMSPGAHGPDRTPAAQGAASPHSVDAPPADLTPEELAAQWAQEEPPPGGTLANAMGALVAFAVGATGIIMSLALGLGTPAQPQPGMWPFLVSTAAAVLAGFQLVVGGPGGGSEKFSRSSILTLFGLLTLIAMTLLMPVIGFEVPSLLLSLVWMKFLGGESWRSAVLYSVLVVAAFYAIFVLGLGTSIPHLF